MFDPSQIPEFEPPPVITRHLVRLPQWHKPLIHKPRVRQPHSAETKAKMSKPKARKTPNEDQPTTTV